ncbi:MAG: response regulator, partial [Desulfosarcinaceae bacterium]
MPKSNFLLIDTDPGSLAQLKSMIEAWGYHVVAMTDFPRSLGWFTQHLPPYVILDADIPGASKFTSEIRTLSADVMVVRQMIEKMSAFIAQVASGVEGGVKYFNELPYFVSVHSADCTVLAANATVLKYLGNRLYANSWDIYAGKRGTRENCPVGRTVRSGNVETTRALVRYASG